MADAEKTLPGNMQGPYYVTEDCVGCEACIDAAPANFRMDDAGGYALVFKQPADDAEKSACDAAMDECPADAIGDDG